MRAGWRLLGALCCAGASLAGLTVPAAGPAAAAAPRLVLVAGGPGPGAADKPIQNLLVARGYTVTVVDDDTFDPGDTSGASGVVVSSTVAPTKIGGFLKTLTLPVVTWEPFIYPTLGMTGGGAARGETAAATTIAIVDPGHALAAGLSGTVTTNTTATVHSFGLPGTSATVVARGVGNRPVLFAYETGVPLVGGGVAPARRVGLFPSAATPPLLTSAGLSLVGSAVAWALSSRNGNPPPVVSAGPDLTRTAGQGAALDGTVTDDGPVTVRWQVVTGPGPVSFAAPTAIDTTATATEPGVYVVSLTANDGTSTVTDTMRLTIRSGTNSGPAVFEVWHGEGATVRRTGWPQVHTNIVGSVRDPDGVVALTYSLNGATARSMGLGPNGRRLVGVGDFNVDLAVATLPLGANTVVLRATDTTGAVTERTVQFSVVTGSAVTFPTTVTWNAALTGAVVADGRWRAVNGSLENVQAGYDRLVAIGDRTWTDYDAEFGFTVRGWVGQTGPNSGSPAVGVIANWNGHNDTITPGSQPLQGFRPLSGTPTPFGTIMWWSNGRMRMIDQTLSTVNTGPTASLPTGVAHRMRVQVDLQGDRTTYRARIWPASGAEPSTWQLQWTSPGRPDEADRGSLVLVAHEGLISVGPVTVTALG